MTLQHKADAIQVIKHSYQVLTEEQDLSPVNARVTESLTKLVRTLTTCQSPELIHFLMSSPDLMQEREHLPNLCSRAESEMEKFWSRKFIADNKCDLSAFWYYSEYVELCRAELALFRGKQFSQISFLGSGALPLTAIILAQELPHTKIICVDFDAESCDLSTLLIKKMGLEKQITVHQMSALEYTPNAQELVICASLLKGREDVYTRLNDKECSLMVRDSEGVYQYLYKAAELPQMPKYLFQEMSKTAINPKRINTSRYFERSLKYA